MKYSSQVKHLRLDIFSCTLEKSLDPTNRWYKLAQSMPWDEIERVYNQGLANKHCGGGNKPARMVIGALLIKHKMNLSDEETIQAIRENPYLQYFVGLDEFTNEPIFDSSLFVHIRKRMDIESINSITLSLMKQAQKKEDVTTKNVSDDNEWYDKSSLDTGSEEPSFMDEDGNKHNGSIKIDATCSDAEVKYPTDIDLLNDARDVSERLIDRLCALSGSLRPKTYRKKARHKFLSVIKKRNKSRKLVRKGIREQLSYLGRNISSISEIIASSSTAFYDRLRAKEKQWISTIIKVYSQQKEMFDNNVHQCADRIISVFQPHVRPIVRGKSKAKVEFGAKIGVSVVQGYTFIDRFSWDAYNESEDLETHIQRYFDRFGCYPVRCYADKIYMNRHNREILKKHHIQAAGKPLGRPSKEMQTEEYKQQSIKDMGQRNEVESTFGTAKRVYRANDIRAKLSNTATVWTALCYLAKNVMKFLKELLCALMKRRCFSSVLLPDTDMLYYFLFLKRTA